MESLNINNNFPAIETLLRVCDFRTFFALSKTSSSFREEAKRNNKLDELLFRSCEKAREEMDLSLKTLMACEDKIQENESARFALFKRAMRKTELLVLKFLLYVDNEYDVDDFILEELISDDYRTPAIVHFLLEYCQRHASFTFLINLVGIDEQVQEKLLIDIQKANRLNKAGVFGKNIFELQEKMRLEKENPKIFEYNPEYISFAEDLKQLGIPII